MSTSQAAQTPFFKDLKPERGLFAFRTGQFDANTLTFHPLDGEGALPPERVAIHYIPAEFDTRLLDGDWSAIETPLFDSIFKHQGYDQDTIDMVYVMVGRLLFPVGLYDKWQVVPFFKGVAGCGKSTVADVIQSLFPSQFVGIISSNMEGIFGLAGLVDRFINVCTEVTSKFPLPRGVFQSMVTGEHVNVAIKNKDALHVKWHAPLVLCGNENLPYDDQLGSVTRRVAIFQMLTQVPEDKVDTTLIEKLLATPAPLLVKFIRAYREVAKEHSEGDFWKLATKQMKGWRKQSLQETDTLSAFLRSKAVVYDSTAKLNEKHLKNAFKIWLTEENLQFKKEFWARPKLNTALTAADLPALKGNFVHGLRLPGPDEQELDSGIDGMEGIDATEGTL